jgi:hypothetical protein
MGCTAPQQCLSLPWNPIKISMRIQLGTLVIGLFAAMAAQAAPFAETGNSQLRADIFLLGNAGLTHDFSGQWPLPWAPLLSELEISAAQGAGPALGAAARRVQARAREQGGFSGAMMLGVTTMPAVVHGFGSLSREKGQAQLSLGYNGGRTAFRLSLGAITGNFTGRSFKFMPDESFIAQKIGDDVVVYGGWVSHWWGPGWISALSLSNNARPMPQVGIQRAGGASSWPVVSWLGPWQAEFFIGLMDDPRRDRNTVFNAVRIAFQPVEGLEIGLSRTEQICGENHPCVPLRDTFDFYNDLANVNATNDQGQIDVRWSHAFFGIPTQFHMSMMNEDSSPVTHSVTSHQFGVTAFLPVGRASPLRLTLEYTDTVPTRNIFGFGSVFHGAAYNNGGYVDGMRYRGRTLGFSLDSDSRLLSLQGAWTDSRGRFWELTYHNAHISNPNNLVGNIVTIAPVRMNIGEARVSLPWNGFKLDLALRLQDDQPRPESGFEAAFESRLRADF